MRTAIVADWLPVYGGAEHVIYELHQLFPDAPIFTTIANRSTLGPLKDADIRTTPLQKWYRLTGKYQWLLPWMPRAIEDIDLRGFDLIISSSHAVAKGVIPPSTARHVCYCHTPMRYAWEMEDQYLEDFKIPRRLRRLIKDKLKDIRRWDLTSAQRVDHFIANSTTVQERIQRIYNRDSVVITPPVSDRFFSCTDALQGRLYEKKSGGYYLAAGRLVPYKRYDLLIDVANAMQLPLKIAGTGSEMQRLKKRAGPTVELLGFVPEEQLQDLYGNAKAFLFAPFEDAGVVPIEAQACGTPVICFGKGGVLDTVIDGETGIYFAEQSVESLTEAITRFEKMTFDSEKIREHARQFRAQQFRKRLAETIAPQ